MSRNAEIFFGTVCALFIGGYALLASAHGMTVNEWVGTVIFALCLLGLFVLFVAAQLGSRGDRGARRRRGMLTRVLRRGDAQVVAEGPGHEARPSRRTNELAL